MKQNRDWNTDYLWKLLIGILSTCIFSIVLLIIYLPLRGTFEKYSSQPRYDKEELARKAEQRARVLRSDWDRVENGIHMKTGLPFDANFKYIKSSCLSCHSSKLIAQNRATREGWQQMIRWMQKTQNLPQLGEKETHILDYLAKHFAPEKTGRRPVLEPDQIEWYVLELE